MMAVSSARAEQASTAQRIVPPHELPRLSITARSCAADHPHKYSTRSGLGQIREGEETAPSRAQRSSTTRVEIGHDTAARLEPAVAARRDPAQELAARRPDTATPASSVSAPLKGKDGTTVSAVCSVHGSGSAPDTCSAADRASAATFFPSLNAGSFRVHGRDRTCSLNGLTLAARVPLSAFACNGVRAPRYRPQRAEPELGARVVHRYAISVLITLTAPP